MFRGAATLLCNIIADLYNIIIVFLCIVATLIPYMVVCSECTIAWQMYVDDL